MNQDQVNGILRIFIPTICAWLAAQGVNVFGDSAFVSGITTVVIAVGAMVWSLFVHTNVAKIVAVTKIDPEIKVVVPPALTITDPKIYNLVANPGINVTTR